MPRQDIEPAFLLALVLDDARALQLCDRDKPWKAVQLAEAGRWREALDGLLKAGVTTGAFPAGLDIGAAVELIIAVTKGVNDSPECATLAFGELERLLRAEEHHD